MSQQRDADAVVMFSVVDVRGVEMEMRAKRSVKLAKVVKAYCANANCDSEGVAIRGVDGTRLAPTSTLAENNIDEGTLVGVTTTPKEQKITIHLSDGKGNELDMVSNNTVKVAKMIATWM